jgi:hypothetical protein
MAASEDNKSNDAALLARLDDLEAKLAENEVLRKRFRNYSLCGVVLLLAIVGIQLLRVQSYVNSYPLVKQIDGKPDAPLEERLKADLEDRSEGREVTLAYLVVRDAEEVLKREQSQLERDFKNKKIVENFRDHFQAELTAAGPEFSEKGQALLDTTQKMVTEKLEQRLLDTMIASIEASGEETAKMFPELKSESELQAKLKSRMDYFQVELHDSLEERLARVIAPMDALQGSVKHLEKTMPEDERAATQAEAEEALIDALLDLLVYHIKPELGQEPAAIASEVAK